MPETLYLTIDLVDRYLSTKVASRKELQLIGISSMLLACKYEEIWAPEAFQQILYMEREILEKMEWNLTVATPYVFLVRFIKATVPSDKEMEYMAFYLADNGLMHYQLVVSFSPSMIAAAAMAAKDTKLKGVHRKFSSIDRGAVALLPSAVHLDS
ncbi:G2/mitotic-specific cyclin-2 [Bienertia sinuspersici]